MRHREHQNQVTSLRPKPLKQELTQTPTHPMETSKRQRSLMNRLSLLVWLFCVGCRYPMNFTKSEWHALTPEQQAGYRVQQYAIDEQRRRDWQAERIRQQEIVDENARLEKERILAAYRNARYGDVVCVVIQGGSIAFNGQPRQFEPVAFDLFKGERRDLEFACQDRQFLRARGTATLSPDGNTLVLEIERHRSVLVNDGWEHGRIYEPRPTATHQDHRPAEDFSVGIRFKPLPVRREPENAASNQWSR